MTDPHSKSEDDKIQDMLQQSSDQWGDQQDQQATANTASPKQPGRSPQAFRNPMMPAMPSGFNPMMNMAMLNPQLQFQLMMQQQMQQMQQSKATQSNIPPETQKPPVGYVCFKCRQPGHWIYYCPNVPKGQFVPRPGMNGTFPQRSVQEGHKKQKPNELTCRICGNLMKDAVLVPCCGKSFCKECITKTLDETHKCPICNKDGLESRQVIPNRSLRNTIEAYKEQNAKEAEEAAAMATETQQESSEATAAMDTGANNAESAQDKNEEAMQDKEQEQNTAEQSTRASDQKQSNTPVKGGGMPIQVFESEERTPRAKHKSQDTIMSEAMPPTPFNANPMMMGAPPGEMNWMMGMPPGMNPAAAAAMMRMNFGMGEGMGGHDMDMGVPPGMPPFMNPAFQGGFGGPEEMFNGMGGPIPGMPPPEMMPFGAGGPMPANPFRAGFSTRGGRGRGSIPRYPGTTTSSRARSNDQNTPASTSSEPKQADENDKEVKDNTEDEVVSTSSRVEREESSRHHRSSSSRYHHRSRSRTPSRSRSPSSRYRRRSKSRSRSRSPKRSRRRSSSRSPSRSTHRRSSQDDRRDKDKERGRERDKDRHSSSRHRSSRHHSSRYRSRERDRSRDRDSRSKDRSSRDKSRERSRRRDRDRR